MRILDRYTLREYLVPVFYCLFAFTMIFVLFDLFDNMARILKAQPSGALVTRYYLLFLLPSLEVLAPASLLLGSMYALWSFARNNELTAMRTSGVSLYRVMLPFVAVGFAFSILIMALRETIVPEAIRWTTQVRRRKFEPEEQVRFIYPVHYYNNVDRRVWEISEFDPKSPGRLINVSVRREREDGSTMEKITAETAEWLDGQWWFRNGSLQSYTTNETFAGEPRPIGMLGAEIRGLEEEPVDFVIEVKASNWDFMSSREMLRYIRTHPHLSDNEIARKSVTFHGRLAMPWACLVVTFFGIPVGARTGRQSVLTSVFVAIAMLFGFYAVSQAGTLLAVAGIVPAWVGAWMSNLLFLGAGIVLMRRME